MTERVDLKALLVTFLFRIKYLIIFGLAGAVIGSSLYLLIAISALKTPTYTYEKEYYISFTYDWSKDYYNDYTWNDVLATDQILGKVMSGLDGYSRDEIKEMVSSRIYSDVRYLTVDIKGKDVGLVEEVGNALNKAILEFADEKEEIASIECVEVGEVKQDRVNIFTKRACGLGIITAVIVYIIGYMWSFSLGESFYTRKDIEERLGIGGLAISEAKDENLIGVDSNTSINDLISNLKKNNKKTIVIKIKQGKKCRASVQELLISARQNGIIVRGAVLVECNPRWLSMYGLKNVTDTYGVR